MIKIIFAALRVEPLPCVADVGSFVGLRRAPTAILAALMINVLAMVVS